MTSKFRKYIPWINERSDAALAIWKNIYLMRKRIYVKKYIRIHFYKTIFSLLQYFTQNMYIIISSVSSDFSFIFTFYTHIRFYSIELLWEKRKSKEKEKKRRALPTPILKESETVVFDTLTRSLNLILTFAGGKDINFYFLLHFLSVTFTVVPSFGDIRWLKYFLLSGDTCIFKKNIWN